MTRLTTSMREQIVDNALEKAGINKAFTEYADERRAWACAVADESIGGPEVIAKLEAANKKIAKAISELPKALQEDLRAGPLEGAIYASFGGMRCRVNEWEGYRPAKSGLMLPSSHQLSERFEALESKKKELDKRKHELKTEIRAVLDSVSTVGKLLAVWPESKELIPAASQKATLPSVSVESLNAAIGLPSDEE